MWEAIDCSLSIESEDIKWNAGLRLSTLAHRHNKSSRGFVWAPQLASLHPWMGRALPVPKVAWKFHSETDTKIYINFSHGTSNVIDNNILTMLFMKEESWELSKSTASGWSMEELLGDTWASWSRLGFLFLFFTEITMLAATAIDRVLWHHMRRLMFVAQIPGFLISLRAGNFQKQVTVEEKRNMGPQKSRRGAQYSWGRNVHCNI